MLQQRMGLAEASEVHEGSMFALLMDRPTPRRENRSRATVTCASGWTRPASNALRPAGDCRRPASSPATAT